MRDDLTGLVLAGGASRRMGEDKALLDVDGRVLVVYVAERLASVCETVLIAPGTRQLHELSWRQIDDVATQAGPLGGILAALAVADTPLVAVAAVDMPDLSPQLYRHLADTWNGEAGVLPVVDGQPQPLHAIYATAALREVAALFDAGERSPARALTRLGALEIELPAGAWIFSLNTPDDLRRFRSRPS